MGIVYSIFVGLLAMGALLTGLNLAGPKAQITDSLVVMLAIVGNKLIGAVYIIGALITLAILVH